MSDKESKSKESNPVIDLPFWHKVDTFSDRQLRLIHNCTTYASNDPAGMPGHNLGIIISKLVTVIKELENELGEIILSNMTPDERTPWTMQQKPIEHSDTPIGEQIKQYRKANRYSQKQFADILGISRTWLSKIERGFNINISYNLMCKIKDAIKS